eukprot:894136-Prymnesium_polylepis.1
MHVEWSPARVRAGPTIQARTHMRVHIHKLAARWPKTGHIMLGGRSGRVRCAGRRERAAGSWAVASARPRGDWTPRARNERGTSRADAAAGGGGRAVHDTRRDVPMT